jgi:two-component system LytT family response regulator
MSKSLRVVLADDERPARRFLTNLLKSFPDVTIVGEADNGKAALEYVEQQRPDLVLLDLHMPEMGGLDVARLLQVGATPLVAFVTAHDEFAVAAFELNAIDYLLKPVERARLASTIERARLRALAPPAERAQRLAAASAALESALPARFLERIPIKHKDETLILPVRQIASIVAEGELLHITTLSNERFVISHRLHSLEERLDPRRFIRLSRGTIAAIDQIQRVSPMPGGTYEVQLANGQMLPVSRIQSRLLKETLLRL